MTTTTVALGATGSTNRTNIQAAIDAATAGDTIVLDGDGSARRPLDVDTTNGYSLNITKPLTLMSNTGAADGLILDVSYTSAGTANFPNVIVLSDAADGSTIKQLGIDCTGATVTTINKELGGISTSLGDITLEDLLITETRVGWVLVHGTNLTARRLECRSLIGSSTTGHHGIDFDERSTNVPASGLVEDCTLKNLLGDALKFENTDGVIARRCVFDGRVATGQNDSESYDVGNYVFEDCDFYCYIIHKDTVAAAGSTGVVEFDGCRFHGDNAYIELASASYGMGGAFEADIHGCVFTGRNSAIESHTGGGVVYRKSGFAAANTGVIDRVTRFVRPTTTYFFLGAVAGYSPETATTSIATAEANRNAGDDLVLIPGDYKVATSQVNATVSKAGRMIFMDGAVINGATTGDISKGLALSPSSGVLEVHNARIRNISATATSGGGMDINPTAPGSVEIHGECLVEHIRPASSNTLMYAAGIRFRGTGAKTIYGNVRIDDVSNTASTATSDGKIATVDGSGGFNCCGSLSITNCVGIGASGFGLLALKEAGEVDNILLANNTNQTNLMVFLGAGAKTLRNPTLLNNAAATNPGIGGYSNTAITWAVSGGILWGNQGSTFNIDPTSSAPPTGAALTFDNCVIEGGQASTTKITATNIYQWNPQIEATGMPLDNSYVRDLVSKWWSTGARPMSATGAYPDDGIALGACQ